MNTDWPLKGDLDQGRVLFIYLMKMGESQVNIKFNQKDPGKKE